MNRIHTVSLVFKRTPRPSANRPTRGFTLIEILMVIVVIGVLAAIAVPQFIAYKATAVDTQMKSDLRNAAVAMESYFVEKKSYPTTVAAIKAVGFTQTAGVTLTIIMTSLSSFTLAASAPNGTKPSFTFNSATGVIN